MGPELAGFEYGIDDVEEQAAARPWEAVLGVVCFYEEDGMWW
ncbi:hypothetical protein ACFVZE_19035 [Streptomyces anulatus]